MVPATIAAIIPAAGSGTRLRTGADVDEPTKALRMLAGRSLLQRSVEALSPYVDEVVIAVPPDDVASFGRESFGLGDARTRLSVVAGGRSRQESVRHGLAALSDEVAWVLVHDAARPLVPGDVVRRVLAALDDGATCVVPAIAPHDSLRELTEYGGNAALDRQRIRLVQTPQGFTAVALRRGHALDLGDLATDDASLVEAAGELVTLVEGDPLAFKITRPIDLALAVALLGSP